MSPFERIAAHYEAQGVPFEPELRRYMEYGFVANTPDFFLMALPTRANWLRKGLRMPHVQGFLSGNGTVADCWYIGGMAGEMALAWKAEPYPLPWFAFERGKRLTILSRDRIRALTSRHLV